MIQGLWADRFKLILHTEMKELPVYALVMARRDGQFGSRLRRSAVDCVAPRDPGVDVSSATTPARAELPRCYQRMGLRSDSSGLPLEAFTANSIAMRQFAIVLSRIVNRQVLDQT